MKSFLKFLLGASLIATIIVAVVFYITSGLTTTADKFFNAVAGNRYEQAYQYVSQEFRDATPPDQLAVFLERNGLTDYQDASWSERSFSGYRGKLVGTIHTRNGRSIPVRVHLVKSNGHWLVDSIFKPRSGVGGSADRNVPSQRDQIALVHATMAEFANAIEGNDFSSFYASVSARMRKQHSQQDVHKAFKAFVDRRFKLKVLNTMTPLFDKQAAVDSHGLLELIGHYPSQPSLKFKLDYVYEGTRWKLTGIDIKIPAAKPE